MVAAVVDMIAAAAAGVEAEPTVVDYHLFYNLYSSVGVVVFVRFFQYYDRYFPCTRCYFVHDDATCYEASQFPELESLQDAVYVDFGFVCCMHSRPPSYEYIWSVHEHSDDDVLLLVDHLRF